MPTSGSRSSRIRSVLGRNTEDDGGEEDTETQCGSHRNQELGLYAPLENEWCHAEKGRDGREHDGPESGLRPLQDRLVTIGPLPQALVDEIDHHKGVVHHHTTEPHDPEEGRDFNLEWRRKSQGRFLQPNRPGWRPEPGGNGFGVGRVETPTRGPIPRFRDEGRRTPHHNGAMRSYKPNPHRLRPPGSGTPA